MQMEKRMQRVWTDAQIAHLAETGLGQREIEQIAEYMSIQKLLNRIERYACCEYGTECSSCIARIQGTATTYADYINMRLELGYDMTFQSTFPHRERHLGILPMKVFIVFQSTFPHRERPALHSSVIS